MSAPGCALGVMFRRENPPEALPTYARQVEAMGLDELWVVEDCFYAGGLTSAAVALAVTDRVRVGLGIMPGVARSPAFSAMEIAALARMYPGRFLPGMGHGMADWMKQIGVFPKSQLAALSETAEVVRRLLAGETVTFHGQHVHHDRVKLEFPPTEAPPLTLGVRGPRSLAMSGRSADGTILAELSSPAYVRWARERIQAGQAEAGRAGAPHRLTVYMLYAVDDDAAAARRRLRPLIASWLSYGQVDYLRPLGIEEEANDLLARGGREALEAGMPNAWIDQMAVVGTPDDCAAAVQRLVDAGADSVGFVTEQPGMEGLAAVARLLPALRPG